jgi:hypothetical protein
MADFEIRTVDENLAGSGEATKADDLMDKVESNLE